MKRIKILSVMLFLLIAISSTSVFGQVEEKSYLILANSNAIPKNLEKDVAKAGGRISSVIPEVGIVVVSSSDPEFTAKLENSKGVRSVVSNLTINWIPSVQQVALEDYGNPPNSGDDDFFFDLQWGHDAVDAPEAWNSGLRGAGVRVAVLDSGFDLDHPDLISNINFDLSKDLTGEGLQYSLPDTFSHGTHTAGTIGAADNAFGTIGIAPEAELVLIKVLGDEGSGSFDDVIEGIVYAANIDADVINMSLGATLNRSGVADEYSAKEAQELILAINRAVTYAYQSGTTVFASAGNEANDGDKDKDLVHVPSDASNAISISATAPRGWALDPENAFLDYPASYTNYGKSVIDFAAPGGDYVYPGDEICNVAGITYYCWLFDYVFSTGNGGWYWSVGTSMAAPHATGVAALLIGANDGDMHPAQVEAALRAYADDLGKPGIDEYYGAGRVDAFNDFE